MAEDDKPIAVILDFQAAHEKKNERELIEGDLTIDFAVDDNDYIHDLEQFGMELVGIKEAPTELLAKVKSIIDENEGYLLHPDAPEHRECLELLSTIGFLAAEIDEHKPNGREHE